MMKRCPDQGGFSLVELMVAIGILAIGAAMIASAFPVAMLENKESVEYTTAAMVSENALAICRNKLRHSDLNNTADAYRDVTSEMSPAEASYPMARLEAETAPADWPRVKAADWVTVEGTDYPSARYGWMVGARQIRDADGVRLNDYELSIVVYQKFLPTDRPGTELTLNGACDRVNYTVGTNPRNPTIGHWVVRTSLRQ